MKCLVTGATGFVGANLVRALVAAGHHVTATGAPGSTTTWIRDQPIQIALADMTRAGETDRLVDGQEWVFHVAGDTSTWSAFRQRRQRVNVDMAAQLADASLAAGVQRFIHTSTVDVHGYNPTGTPVDERGGARPFTGLGYDYAETKLAGEHAVRARIPAGLDVVVVYPGFMIGPFDHTLQLGRVIRDMQTGKRTFAPPGSASFCDVRSVTAGMLASAERGRTGEGYILAGHNLSYASVFARMAVLVGAKHRPVTVPSPALRTYGQIAAAAARFTHRPPEMDPGLAAYMCAPQAADSSKATTELGYDPGDLDDSIIAAARWYDNNASADEPRRCRFAS